MQRLDAVFNKPGTSPVFIYIVEYLQIRTIYMRD